MTRLSNTTALITGAGRGIGRAIALAYAQEGAAVALVARSEEEITAVAQEIKQAGGQALPVRADVGRQNEVEEAVARAVEQFGRLDIMVNNAAIARPGDLVNDAFEAWNEVIQVNLYGAIYGARAAAHVMIERGIPGSIINISSIHGYRAEPGSSHYDVAKGGMDQLTRALAVDLAPYSIRVNSIAPGFISTSMSVTHGVNELETDWFRDIYVARRKIPLARAGEAHEVAGAAVFLASAEASYITGHVLVVDGGLSVTF